MPNCKNPADLRFALQKHGIELEYKHSRTSNEIEGVSFRYDNICFKGSQIDRKLSFGNLKKEFEKNLKIQQEQEEKAKKETEKKAKASTIGGIELTSEQWKILKEGGHIYLDNMNRSNGKGQFSSYVFLNDEKDKAFFCKEHPDTFVKYGKYEMRIRDKILVENGHLAKAKVKWYGGGLAYPYLWKMDKSDT